MIEVQRESLTPKAAFTYVFNDTEKSLWNDCFKMGTRLEVKSFSALYNSLGLYRPPSVKLIIVSVWFCFVFHFHLVKKQNSVFYPLSSLSLHKRPRTLERSSSYLTLLRVMHKVRSSQWDCLGSCSCPACCASLLFSVNLRAHFHLFQLICST